MSGYVPPTIKEGTVGRPGDEPFLAPGVRGYAISSATGWTYIPLIIAEKQGSGDVGRFLDSLAKCCCIPNVNSPRLRGMLERRGYITRVESFIDSKDETVEWCEVYYRP